MKKRWAILRWTGTVILLLTVAVWVASFTYEFQANLGPIDVDLKNGGVDVNKSGEYIIGGGQRKRVPRSWHFGWRILTYPKVRLDRSAPRWWIEVNDFGNGDGAIFLPLWIPTLLLAVPVAFAWRSSWRNRLATNTCRKCNYSLTGLPPNSPCPECGGGGKGGGTKAPVS